MSTQVFNTVRRVVSGPGCLAQLGDEIRRLGGEKALLVTDPGVVKAGLSEPVKEAMTKAGIACQVFSGVEPDPKVEVAELCVESCQGFSPTVVVGLGGGSSLDIAKVTSVMVCNQGPLQQYFGMELVPKPGLPLILIPTTAGTGSEMTSIAVLHDSRQNVKKGVVSEHMAAKTVLLDPELTLGLPPRLTATTGMDALVHAIESFTGLHATPFTDALNRQAIAMIADNLRAAFANGDDIHAREQMLMASSIAGMAFSNTQNGLVHGLGLAIGGRYGLPHGLLIAAISPWVMEYNAMACAEKYGEIAMAFGEDVTGLPARQAAQVAVEAIKELLDDLGISYRMGDYGVQEEDIPALAKATMGAARLLGNNPRKVHEAEVVRLLEENI